MVSCPFCREKSRNNFEYCRFCGSKLSGETVGDFKTDMLNVFKHENEYIYLFSVGGRQVVLKAESLEELADLVDDHKFPWEFKDWKNNFNTSQKQTMPAPEFETDFLKASSLKEPEIIPMSSTKKELSDESYIPEYEVSRVVDDN